MKTLIKKLKGKNKKGKNVLIIAGVHGNEITPVYTLAHMLSFNLFDKHLESVKSITVINGLNMSGLKSGERDMQSRGTQDLNRSFHSEEEEECIDLLKEHIKKNDAVIDIHSSPTCAEFALIDIDEYMVSIEKWCKEAGINGAVRYSGANTIKRYCLEQGKMAVTLEINKLGLIDFKSSDKCIKMLDGLIESVGEVELSKNPVPNGIQPIQELSTHATGIMDFNFNNGELFSEGMTLYTVHDLEMNVIETFTADFDGWVVCEPSRNFVSRGDTVYMVQPFFKIDKDNAGKK
jgi:predicted deacylase